MLDITGSIVTYKNDLQVLAQAMASFLASDLKIKLYVVDNSPTDEIKSICQDPRIEYIFNNANVGFGAGHNIAIRRSLGQSPYHLVLNPDIYFDGSCLKTLLAYMEAKPQVGLVMPKVLYPDGSLQYLCKLLPTPFVFFARRFLKSKKLLNKINYTYELKFTGYNREMNVPYLSGCFMFLKNEALEKVGLFDEKIFMYSEDTDLTRRIHRHYQTAFYPGVSIYHHFAKGSHKSLKLLYYGIHGSIVYFNKWGWFFDSERKEINRKVLAALK